MNARNRLGFELVATCVAMVGLAPALGLAGQGNGLPQDWSHRYLIVSNPAALEEEVLLTGTLDDWQGLVNDPRFIAAEERSQGSAAAKARKEARQAAKAEASAATRTLAVKAAKPPPPSPDVDWSVTGLGGPVAAGVFPAKYSFSPIGTPDCGSGSAAGDFVVFPLNVVGTDTTANIVAFNNLYTHTDNGYCGSHATPSALWAYRTPNAITTSPVLSLDGTAVAWVDYSGSTTTLRVLHTQLGSGTSGIFPNKTVNTSSLPVLSACNFSSFTRPCLFSLQLTTTAAVTGSLFVNYADSPGGSAYATDNQGWFYKIMNLFSTSTTPSLAWTNTNGRVQVANRVLTSPIYDFNNNVLAVDTSGYIHKVVDPGNGNTVTTTSISSQLATDGTVRDGLLLSLNSTSSNNRVFFFAGQGVSGQTRTGTGCLAGNNCAVAVQATTASPPAQTAWAPISPSGEYVTNQIWSGAFNNNYYTNASNAFLYVCGIFNSTKLPGLYKIGFTTQPTMNTASDFQLNLSAGNKDSRCSGPLTEYYNTSGTGADYLFVGIDSSCQGTGTNKPGCVRRLILPSGGDNPVLGTTVLTQTGGTSGIVIDNSSISEQASSIYFGQLGANTVVKLTQSGLQ